jgi:transposase
MSPVILQLTLPGYRIIRVESNDLMRVELEVLDTPPSCPYCAGSSLRSKGRYQRRVRHLEAFGHQTFLTVHCRRYWCRDCDVSFVQALPGILPGRHSSEPYRNVVYERHHDGVPASCLARSELIGAATVGRIYAQFTQRKASERLSTDCPQVLGIDEHTLHRGLRFATTFCDLKGRRVFDIAPGRSEAELRPCVEPHRGRPNVPDLCQENSKY